MPRREDRLPFDRHGAAGVALLAALASGPAPAAEASAGAAPAPTVGDTWTYRRVDLYTGLEIERHSMRFVRADGAELRFESVGRDGRVTLASRTAELGSCNRAKDIAEPKCGSVYRFPLVLGGKSGYSRLPNDGEYGFSNQDCVVAARESVTVPAGTFDAFRVECSGIWLSGLGQLDYVYQGQLSRTHWYAPAVHGEVKTIVKVYKNRGGLDTQELVELVSFANRSDAAAAAAAAGWRPLDPSMPREFSAGTTRFAGRFARDPGNTSYSGEGRVVWANGDVYEGRLERGQRVGRGRFDWANGQSYDGEWLGDAPHGRGVMHFSNGGVYDGEIVAGRPQGLGAMAYASGARYVGELAAGVPHGRGRYTWADGQVLECVWVEGQGQGPGVLRFGNGDVYEGSLKDGRPDGSGRTTFVSGDRYEGMQVAGVPHGTGTYVWKSGARYEGEWKAGTKHGRGRMTAADGSTSEGLFVDDRLAPP